jgi:D-glycero-alpha-D-manno-heptose 1-phosphate guanylyltransferase
LRIWAAGRFLDILLGKIWSEGFERVILAVAHMKDRFIAKYGEDPRISFSEEEIPLGTGGAVKKAIALARSPHVMVMNGDSYFDIDLNDFYENHLKQNAPLSIAVTEIEDISDRGSVTVEDGRITAFREKIPEKRPGLISTGAYVVGRDALAHFPEEDSFSLETDFFPRAVTLMNVAAYRSGGVLDIGTPERYEAGKQRFGNIDR